ncbi:recombinase family protein [Oscillospiraceae bacterium PP1C4]
MIRNSQKKVLIYCRESRDDNGENYERIETQRDILVDFCKRQGLTNIIEIIMDDNVSGTKFSRFYKITEMVQNHQIDVLVFKDASRLGRNLRESLNFMHFLEEAGVEVLFESETYDEAFFPLLAWFNEQRAREDSAKVRRVFRHKMETGELLLRPPYGYLKEDNHLAVDPVASVVVRRVFALFLDGYGTYEIATILNFDKILTPSQATRTNLCTQAPVCYAWNSQHIYRMITNQVYTGDMVYSKRTKKSFKSTKYLSRAPEDWIVIQNHHAPIVSKEEFERVQQLRRKNNSKNRTTREPKLFSGLVFCGRCGAQLIQRIRKNRPDAYLCAKNQKEGGVKDEIRPHYGCKSHHISEKTLAAMTTAYFRSLLACDDAQLYSLLNLSKAQQEHRDKKKTAADLQKEMDQYEVILDRIYDDRLGSIISESVYLKKTKEYNQKISDCKKELQNMQSALSAETKMDADELHRTALELVTEDLDNRRLKKIFDKAIYYLEDEISEEDKAQYNLPDECYQKLKQEGGILFVINEVSEIRDHTYRI